MVLGLVLLGPLTGTITAFSASAKSSAEAKKAAKGTARDKAKAKAGKDEAKSAKSKDAAKDAKSKNASAKETKSKDDKSKNAKSKDVKTKDAKTKGAAPKDTAKAKSGTDGTARDAEPAAVGEAPVTRYEPTFATSATDIAAVKQAISLARQGKATQATEEQQAINDPVARKLVEWAILRSDHNGASFSRFMAFISANPRWPGTGMFRRRAEAMLWTERAEPATVRNYFGREQPLTARGRFALARALLAQGDRAGAQTLIREGWLSEGFSPDFETQVLESFGSFLSTADHKARMDMRLYADDVEGAMRSANRAGGHAPTIAKARAAVIKKAGNTKALLDAVPNEAQGDVGLIFSRAQMHRRAEQTAEAVQLVLSVPRDPQVALDPDQWWIERRLIARKLLDLGDAPTAYRIARDAVIPLRENYRIEHQFTAGWIALRFLNDPATAQSHFSRISERITNPISLSRASYWQGRAAEAMGRNSEARAHYEVAAQYPTAYYGQIAGARLGIKDLILRAPPARPDAAQLEIARAVEYLYAIGERDMVTGIAADLGDRGQDAVTLAAIGDVTERANDARAMLHLGKSGLGRDLPLEKYAFPTIGIPDYRGIGPAIDSSIVYAIARQESTFNQRTVSTAKAMGLMQVTPDAGRYVAKKFGVTYDGKRLLSDPVYNVQMGAAELGDLFINYRGSYILTFAGYNAGSGRVRDWIARYGDPRDPNVDPIDWVERIPFAETRNYVQRVMENLQVYRVRFGRGNRLQIEADMRRGSVSN
jgi:soluble lytic murein transglycosylase